VRGRGVISAPLPEQDCEAIEVSGLVEFDCFNHDNTEIPDDHI